MNKEDTQDTLARQVRAARARRGLTRAALAAAAGLTADEVLAIEQGTQQPTVAQQRALARALQLDDATTAERPRAARRASTAGEPTPVAETAPLAQAAPVAETAPLAPADHAPATQTTAADPPQATQTTASRPSKGPRMMPDSPPPAETAASGEPAASTTARRREGRAAPSAQPRPPRPPAHDAEAAFIATLERVTGRQLVHDRGRAWLLEPRSGVPAGTRREGAIALLVEALLAPDVTLSAGERAELARLYQALQGRGAH